MATFRCLSCQATYTSPQRDGYSYFHACAPIHNPAYDAQFQVDENGDLVPIGPLDPMIPPMMEQPEKRDENVERKPDGTMGIKSEGKGRELLP